ncbi:hypothetical protein IE53DRAFT_391017 [Violaceomyces palustris]|uniref:Uncharacterized protein n=1 Tax=Violaceomyces palustris TaxID=1673888 RepID=A0ACD0NM17_9BASI|nr:hypothetical protein IE53DRAFT_391017 [Violaceomyces palustris]
MALEAASSKPPSLLEKVASTLQSAISPSQPKDHEKSLTKDIVVKQIFIHPIKSCKGSSVEKADYDQAGLKFDRTWLIIDAETRKFYTARDLPKMVLIHPKMDLENNKLIIDVPLNHNGKGTVSVHTPLEPSQKEIEQFELIDDITIWIHKVNGYAVSPQADQVLSEFFGKPVRLVRKGPSRRPSGPLDPEGPKEWTENSVRYQDFYPCLVATTASIKHVQDTLKASLYPSPDDKSKLIERPEEEVKSYKVPKSVDREYWTLEELENLSITRFRPNIVVTSTGKGDPLVPWEEDGWEAVECFPSTQVDAPYGKEAEGKGKGVYLIARCARCMVPNIDPETGKRDNFLPYRVLQEFRQVDEGVKGSGKPCFGMLSVPREISGTIRVGDIVRVTRTTDPSKRSMKLPSK